MTDNLTPGMRAAMDEAMGIAAALSHPNVHAVHLLAGIVATGSYEGLPQLDLDTVTEIVDSVLPEPKRHPGALAPSAARVLSGAVNSAMRAGNSVLDVGDVLGQLTDGTDQPCTSFLVAASAAPVPAPSAGQGRPVPRAVSDFVQDLTQAAREGRLTRAVGRDDEVERALIVLGRRSKNNPVFTGPAGVGKTALAEEIACRIASGHVPDELSQASVWSVDLGSLIAGTAARGDWEAKVKKLLEAATSSTDPVILFVDELHALVGAGGSQNGGTSASDLLKPALARPNLRVMGATTTDEYRKHVAKDAALERRFTPVEVSEPSEELATVMLRGWAAELSSHHGVEIAADAVTAAVKNSAAIADRALPDRAIDVLDEACARVHLARVRGGEGPWLVGKREVGDVVAAMTGLPLSALGLDADTELLSLHQRVSAKVIGQREAVEEVCRLVTRRRSGVSSLDRPGSLLLVGPTGVGKTHLVKSVAEEVYGPDPAGRNKLIVVDCSEVSSDAALSTLIGAPPGYVGYDDSVSFLEKVRRNPDCIVLFDEVDKAAPAVYDMLLQVLDEGRLTDGAGRKVSFSSAVVLLTSNHGAHNAGRTSGFASEAESMRQAAMSAVKEAFRPEFLNRLDGVVLFTHLDAGDAAAIAALEVAALVGTASASGVTLRVHDSVIEFLATSGLDPKYGARGMRRLVSDCVADAVADVVIAGSSDVTVVVEDGVVAAAATKLEVLV